MSDQPTDAAAGAWAAAPDAVPATMKAVVFREFGGPDVLQVAEVTTPEPAPGEILVRVAAVGVGRLLDLVARAGRHPYATFAFPHILGAEHVGTVAAVGAQVDTVRVGDRVAVFPAVTCGDCTACRDSCSEACAGMQIIGVHRPGAYAEYSRVPAVNARVVPGDIGAADAAGLALSGPVALNQLTQAGIGPGDWVLVQGAASALGSVTAALAHRLGARVIATSRAAWKRQRLSDLGIAAALDPTGDGFVDEVLAMTGGAGVNVAIDNLGDPAIWERTLDVLATRGTVVSSGAFLGGRVELNLMRLYSRCQRVLGVRTGNLAAVERLWQEVERGFRPVIDRTFPVARAADAHRYLESDSNLGRVTLTTVGADWSAD